MRNQHFSGTPTQTRFAKCPSTIVAGDAVLIGSIPAVALNDYDATLTGCTFYTGGSFVLTVVGATVVSPQTPAALKPGDKVYASGSLDSSTNVTHTLTISGATGDTLFGTIDPDDRDGVLSGVTDTAAIVRLLGSE